MQGIDHTHTHTHTRVNAHMLRNVSNKSFTHRPNATRRQRPRSSRRCQAQPLLTLRDAILTRLSSVPGPQQKPQQAQQTGARVRIFLTHIFNGGRTIECVRAHAFNANLYHRAICELSSRAYTHAPVILAPFSGEFQWRHRHRDVEFYGRLLTSFHERIKQQ